MFFFVNVGPIPAANIPKPKPKISLYSYLQGRVIFFFILTL